MHQPTKFSTLKKHEYLAKIRAGMRRGAAAEAVGISPWTVRNHARANPEFAGEIDEAEIAASEVVEDALWRKALEGNTTAIIFYLVNRSAGRWQRYGPSAEQGAAHSGLSEGELNAQLRHHGFVDAMTDEELREVLRRRAVTSSSA